MKFEVLVPLVTSELFRLSTNSEWLFEILVAHYSKDKLVFKLKVKRETTFRHTEQTISKLETESLRLDPTYYAHSIASRMFYELSNSIILDGDEDVS